MKHRKQIIEILLFLLIVYLIWLIEIHYVIPFIKANLDTFSKIFKTILFIN